MSRLIIPEAEAILDKEFKVLDHGFVRAVSENSIALWRHDLPHV
jgi:hypothetical protein